MKKNRGFNFLELIITVIIITVMGAIAIPAFRVTQERALDNEAKANVKLIQAAQKIYSVEYGGYFAQSTNLGINTNFRVSVPASLQRTWDYTTDAAGTVTAIPFSPRVTRTWTLSINQDEPN